MGENPNIRMRFVENIGLYFNFSDITQSSSRSSTAGWLVGELVGAYCMAQKRCVAEHFLATSSLCHHFMKLILSCQNS